MAKKVEIDVDQCINRYVKTEIKNRVSELVESEFRSTLDAKALKVFNSVAKEVEASLKERIEEVLRPAVEKEVERFLKGLTKGIRIEVDW